MTTPDPCGAPDALRLTVALCRKRLGECQCERQGHIDATCKPYMRDISEVLSLLREEGWGPWKRGSALCPKCGADTCFAGGMVRCECCEWRADFARPTTPTEAD